MKYEEIVKKAKEIKETVESEYKLPYSTPVYYIAKTILNQSKKDVANIKIRMADHSTGDYFSRQIYKTTYLDMAKRLTQYVEKNNQLPNYITDNKNKKMKVTDYVYMFSNILIEYDKTGKQPDKINVNSKAFTQPIEYPNKVYGLFVKHTGIKPKYLDDVCDWVKKYVTYLFYFDDQETNEEVIKYKKGNCTDLLQMLCNMAEAMDYEFKVIHTKCRQSGTGHVYGKFRKKGSSEWFIRDIACIADNSDYCVWCNVDTGAGYLLEVNPAWFLENLHR